MKEQKYEHYYRECSAYYSVLCVAYLMNERVKIHIVIKKGILLLLFQTTFSFIRVMLFT